jgi:hypothetical protein
MMLTVSSAVCDNDIIRSSELAMMKLEYKPAS